jgi:4-amino-4-deoxy-L-arabinose transferase-like glycosyltransferase
MTATLAPPTEDGAPPAPPTRRRSRREWISMAVLLVGTAVLYLWNLGASGYSNSFYAASVQAGTKSWKALLFASLDAGNTVTVDKPPAAMWVMGLSGRIFGFNSWSMLVPEALMGVAAVALLYAAVRRVSGPTAALLAGAVLALTPVAVLMFKFNNPDALLVLLMVAAAYAVVRATEVASTRWLVLAGVLIGFGFLTKMMQAFLVLPAFVLVYLICAPTGLWRRVRQLLASAVALVVAAGWYVALVEFWPADSRPYIGGSTGNSLLELALGYNGLGRIFGGEGGGGGGFGGGQPNAETLPPVAGGTGTPELFQVGGPGGGGPGGGGGGGFGGTPGLGRMFNETSGGQISWLLPAALVLFVLGLWLLRKAPRTDRVRASLLLWGGWTVVTMLVFSLAQGIFHDYYTVALAPGIAGLIGVGGRELWRHRESVFGRVWIAVLVAGTAAWAWVLLGRTPDFLPWLRWVVLALAAVAVVAALVPRAGRRIAVIGALVAVFAGIAAPAAYAVQTAGTAHTGSIPTAGPQTAGGGFGGMPGAGGRGGGRAGDGRGDRTGGQNGGQNGTAPDGTAANGTAPGGDAAGGAQAGGFGGAPGGGGPGGEGATADPALIAALQAAGTKWSAAAIGSMSGGALALQSDTNVMSIGGFTGSDPAPTLAQFQAEVAAGEIHYFIPGGGFGGGGGAPANGEESQGQAAGTGSAGRAGGGGFGRGGTSEEITTWVEQNYASTSVGGQTLYDLTTPVG